MGKKRQPRTPSRKRAPARAWLAGSVLVALVLVLSAVVRLLPSAAGPGKAAASEPRERGSVERLEVSVVATHPHDSEAYTQGLLWHDGSLFESTGTYGRSSLRRISLGEEEPALRVELADDLFGEGLARIGDRLVQLTWRQGLALVYRAADLSEVERIRYVGEGWGLTYDGRHLVLSDGTHVLSYRDPESLAELRRLEVTRDGTPQDRLNELEWVHGRILANVYQTDEIVRIDPQNGRVDAVVDASGLLSTAEASAAEVLNGIAYRPETDTYLLTGKYWPKLFEVRFVAPGK